MSRGLTQPSEKAIDIKVRLEAELGRRVSWGSVIRAQLKAQEFPKADEQTLIEICNRVANEMSEQRVMAAEERARREVEGIRAIFRGLRDQLLPFLNAVDLMPGEEIISLAIKMPDGEVRIVSIE